MGVDPKLSAFHRTKKKFSKAPPMDYTKLSRFFNPIAN